MSLAFFPFLNSPQPRWSCLLPWLDGNESLHPFSISTSLFALAFLASDVVGDPLKHQPAKYYELWSSDPWLIHSSLYSDEPETWLSGYSIPSSDFHAVSKHSDIFKFHPKFPPIWTIIIFIIIFYLLLRNVPRRGRIKPVCFFRNCLRPLIFHDPLLIVEGSLSR